MLEKLSLDGKTIIVTGGGTGLGRAMVRALAKAGADLVIAARRIGPIEESAEEVRSLGRRALAIPTDVTDTAQINSMVQRTLDEFGKIDVLINNAGGIRRRSNQRTVRREGPPPIWEITDEDWYLGIEIELNSAFYCARAVAKHMVGRGQGKIINIGSGFGMRGVRDNYMHACGKGGMAQLTRTLATSLGRSGVTSNCILPGWVPVEITDDVSQTSQPRAQFIPVGFTGKPDDMGPAAVFMASSASDYMNGEFLAIDGGGLFAGVAPTGHAPNIPLKV